MYHCAAAFQFFWVKGKGRVNNKTKGHFKLENEDERYKKKKKKEKIKIRDDAMHVSTPPSRSEHFMLDETKLQAGYQK